MGRFQSDQPSPDWSFLGNTLKTIVPSIALSALFLPPMPAMMS